MTITDDYSFNTLSTFLDIVDKEVLIDRLEINIEWCEKARIIWKKMQRRRLSRG